MEQITMVRVEDLHPHEKNPRIDAASVADLVESIKVHGIEVPLVAAPQVGNSEFVVLAGHRRLTAAHELGLAEVPVQIRQDLADARDQMAFMATENLHRDQLTAVEESRLVQDMLDLGMSQAEIAKQTALGKKRVSERVKLGKVSEAAGEKLHRGQITVDDALIIAEYSDDPQIVEELEATAGTHMFDWKVSTAKQRREHARKMDEARKRAKGLGLRLVEADADFVSLGELLTEVGWTTPALDEAAANEVDGREWSDLVHAEHRACPGQSGRIIEYGYQAGDIEVGCDQVATQHGEALADTAEEPDPEPEPADPWDEITAEDFATARVHRQEHLAKTLPGLDVADEAIELMAENLLGQCWREWGENPPGIELLEAITGVEGKSRVRRKLQTWPLALLVWLNEHWWDISSHHKYQGEGRQGSSYWGEKGKLRQLLERTGYAWSEPEQKAILLATGKAHDATDDAEAGEAA